MNQANAEQIDSLIWVSCHVMISEVDEMIHDEFYFSEGNARWFTKLLCDKQEDNFKFKLSLSTIL
jgi:hypothetical protein